MNIEVDLAFNRSLMPLINNICIGESHEAISEPASSISAAPFARPCPDQLRRDRSFPVLLLCGGFTRAEQHARHWPEPWNVRVTWPPMPTASSTTCSRSRPMSFIGRPRTSSGRSRRVKIALFITRLARPRCSPRWGRRPAVQIPSTPIRARTSNAAFRDRENQRLRR